MIIVILILYMATITNPLRTNEPIWITSDYFQAGNQNVIATLTGQDQTPQFTFNFSPAFPGTPLIGYGVKSYEGGDYFGPQNFYVERVDLTSAYFKVLVQIVGSTYIWTLNVPYIAISPAFPHKIISFDNVPANYSDGPLNIFSTRSDTSVEIYTNTINFTQQAAGLDFDTFDQPYSRNKIVLFTSSFYIHGTNEGSGDPANPLDLNISANAISSSEYQIEVQFGIRAKLEKLRFSQIIFDQQEILDSGKYALEYYTIDVGVSGGFFPVEEQFANNLIVGFTDFSSDRTKVIFDTKYTFETIDGVFGINFPQRVAHHRSDGSIKQSVRTIKYSVFYLKTWYCPDDTPLFYYPTQLCTTCGVAGCDICFETYKCEVCSYNDSYAIIEDSDQCEYCNETRDQFINDTDYSCYNCSLQGCLDCLSFDVCLDCDNQNGYHLDINSSTCKQCQVSFCLDCIDDNHTKCQQCNETADYFLINYDCISCPVDNCLDCASIDACLVCDENNSYFLNSTTSLCDLCTIDGCIQCKNLEQCAVCNQTADFFLNNQTQLCEPCELSYCIDCFSLQECLLCNETAQYFLNISSDLCQPCPVENCIECISFNDCAVCDEQNNFFLNSSDNQCVECPVSDCINCSSFYTCKDCNESDQYFLNTTDELCVECPVEGCLECESFWECEICNETGGYFLNQSQRICVVCPIQDCLECQNIEKCKQCNETGDFLISSDQTACIYCSIDYCLQCSSPNVCLKCDNRLCLSEDNLQCTVCPENMLDIKQQQLSRIGCNKLSLKFSVNQNLLIEQLQNKQNFLNCYVISTQAEYLKNENKYQITVQYGADLPNNIQYRLSNGQIIQFKYQDEIPGIFYTQQECQAFDSIQSILLAVEVVSYAILLLSVIASCKIVGLQLFGLLQLAYFNLANNTYWNIYLAPLKGFSHLNGFNTQFFSDQQQNSLPQQINQMEVSPEFLNNCNVMLLLLIGQMFLGFILYIISKVALPNHEGLKKYSQILLKQGLITFVLFNTLNIAFSAGIHWKYSSGESFISSFALYAGLAVIFGTSICMQFTSKKGYGEFKDKFKNEWPSYSYICIYALYQCILGIYISSENQSEQATFLVLGFCIFYSVYFGANLPFKMFYQNYRAGFIIASQFSILLITNYYRSMKSTTQMSIKARIHDPAILEIALLCMSTGFSALALSYEFYIWIKGKITSYQSNKKIENRHQQSDGFIFQETYLDN